MANGKFMNKKIKIGIIGMGNCASSIIQGISYYQDESRNHIGLMHYNLGGYKPDDIEVVITYDIDKRKVGKPIEEAIFQLPNCTKIFNQNIPKTNLTVKMGKILDGFSPHLLDYDEKYRIVISDEKEPTKDDIIDELKKSRCEILLNYMTVGSQQATEYWADIALEYGCSLINCIPVFIASDDKWAKRFDDAGLPIIGDDVKSQLGATILHRTLAGLFKKRGVRLEKTYQLNTGGNMDFLNMLNKERLKSKKTSKTEAVQSILAERLEPENIHIGPSDYVSWQKDNKVCFLRMEGKLFGDIPMNIELRLSVEDSPNSAGVVIDAIRCCKLALDRGIGGVLYSPSAYFMKHPMKQYNDDDAYQMVEDFINGDREN